MQNLFLPRIRPHKTSCPIVLDLILTFKDTPTSLESQLIQPNHAYFCSDSGSFSMCCDLALVERLREGWLSQIGWKIGKNPNGLQPPLHIRKIMLQIFCNRYGRIYARRYEGQIIWNACIWFPEMGTILGGGGGQLPFGTYPKNHPFWCPDPWP